MLKFFHTFVLKVTVHKSILRNWGTCAELVMSITLLHTAVLLMCVLWAVRSSKEMLFLPTPHSSAVMYL